MDTNTTNTQTKTLQRLLIIVVAVLISFIVWKQFFDTDINAYDKLHKDNNKVLQKRVNELELTISKREAVILSRNDSIDILKKELISSEIKTSQLSKKLQHAKTTITRANDDDNVSFFREYIITAK